MFQIVIISGKNVFYISRVGHVGLASGTPRAHRREAPSILKLCEPINTEGMCGKTLDNTRTTWSLVRNCLLLRINRGPGPNRRLNERNEIILKGMKWANRRIKIIRIKNPSKVRDLMHFLILMAMTLRKLE